MSVFWCRKYWLVPWMVAGLDAAAAVWLVVVTHAPCLPAVLACWLNSGCITHSHSQPHNKTNTQHIITNLSRFFVFSSMTLRNTRRMWLQAKYRVETGVYSLTAVYVSMPITHHKQNVALKRWLSQCSWPPHVLTSVCYKSQTTLVFLSSLQHLAGCVVPVVYMYSIHYTLRSEIFHF